MLIRQEHAQKQSKIGMDTDEASDVQVLFKALCNLLAQLHFLPLLAEEIGVAEALTVGHLEWLSRLYLIVDALDVCLRKRFNRFVSLKTRLQG